MKCIKCGEECSGGYVIDDYRYYPDQKYFCLGCYCFDDDIDPDTLSTEDVLNA